MQAIRKATLALLGVTVLWGGTFIWMQQSLNAAAAALPNVPEDDVNAVQTADREIEAFVTATLGCGTCVKFVPDQSTVSGAAL